MEVAAVALASALAESIRQRVQEADMATENEDAMTADNRTNEPKPTETKRSQDFVFTEEQVEAAAKAIADCHNPGMFERYPENWRVEARAALVAAQGAARSEVDIRVLAEVEVRKSVVEGNPVVEPGVTKEIAFVRGAVWGAAQGAAPQAESEYEHLLKARALHQTNAGLPSSGVDEDKLAEVIASVTDLWDDPLDEVHDIPQIARAVAAWLKGQGR